MKTKIIHLDIEVKESIATHSELTYPYDCCGFVFGEDSYGRYITHSIPAQNLLDNVEKAGYKISATDFMNAERFAQEENLQLLGIYNSKLSKNKANHSTNLSLHPTFSVITFELENGKLSQITAKRIDESSQVLREDKIIVTSSILN